MALNRVTFPTTPYPVAGDWELLVNLVSKSFQNINNPIQFNGSTIPEGSLFQIGGIIYYADSDTTIAGTQSDYVKLTPNSSDDGATCDAVFVSSITDADWNPLYNGYYDIATNKSLYVFDESAARISGIITEAHSYIGRHANVTVSTSDPVDGVGQWGDLWFKREA